MKVLSFMLFLLFPAPGWALPDPRDSIILESKTVSPGAHPGSSSDTAAYVYLKVWITNKDALSGIFLNYEEKSLSGGAYLVVAHPRDFEGTVSRLTTKLPTGYASYSGYNSQSPDTGALAADAITSPFLARTAQRNPQAVLGAKI
jgi:hypothetical protein